MEGTVYKNKYFSIEEKSFNGKDGGTSIYNYMKVGLTVSILPVLNDKKIILERQFRHALGKYIYEIPAGHGETGEDPKTAAARELEEETGYKAGRVRFMFKAFVSPGFSTELLHYFVADNLQKTKTNLDKDEDIEIFEVSFEKALDMIKNNEIESAMSINSILFYLKFFENNK